MTLSLVSLLAVVGVELGSVASEAGLALVLAVVPASWVSHSFSLCIPAAALTLSPGRGEACDAVAGILHTPCRWGTLGWHGLGVSSNSKSGFC